MRLISVLFLLAFYTVPAFAQDHLVFQARTFKYGTITISYRLFVPKNYDPSKRYPIVTALHGIGERGSDNNIQVDREDIAKPWIADSIQNRVPHFVLVPQCPANLYWWPSTTGTGPTSTPALGVVAILDSLKREFSLDTNRYYLAGLSMGAMGGWDLLKKYPKLFAAAVLCSGLGDTTAVDSVANTPFWAFHGSVDGTVNVSGSRDMVTAVERKGKKVVRFVSQAYFNAPSLTIYSDTINKGKDPVAIVAKSPTGISYDSLQKAVAGGANYLYSEVTNGDHRTGWMVGWHHPLVTPWIFSKSKSVTPVAIVSKNSGRPQVRAYWKNGVLVPWRGEMRDVTGRDAARIETPPLRK